MRTSTGPQPELADALSRVQAGDLTGWSVLCSHYRPLLVGYLLRVTRGRREDAEDMAHATLAAAMVAVPKLPPGRLSSPDNLEDYLYASAHNAHVSAQRKRYGQRRGLDASPRQWEPLNVETACADEHASAFGRALTDDDPAEIFLEQEEVHLWQARASAVRAILPSLTAQSRAALSAFLLAGSIVGASQSLGIGQGAAKARIGRAIGEIRRRLLIPAPAAARAISLFEFLQP